MSPFIVVALSEQVQMCAGDPLSVWICMGCSIDVKPHEHNYGSYSVLKSKLCQSESAAPNVQKEPLSVVGVSEFIRFIDSRWNSDRRWATHEMLGQLSELIRFSLR
jgi:hypothetical protein